MSVSYPGRERVSRHRPGRSLRSSWTDGPAGVPRFPSYVGIRADGQMTPAPTTPAIRTGPANVSVVVPQMPPAAAAQPSEVTEIGQRWPRLVNVGRYCCATSGEEDRTVKLLPPPVRFASQLASHWTCR